jgi:membrane protein involved in colicin uptake
MLYNNVGNWRTQLKSISMLSCALLTCTVLGMSGCNKAQSPDKVRDDIAAAQNEAAQDKAKAEEKRKSEERQASADLAKEKADAQSKAADRSVAAVADAAVTEAQADTNVALAKCESLEGDAQQKVSVF